jgi:hypothetical protein
MNWCQGFGSRTSAHCLTDLGELCLFICHFADTPYTYIQRSPTILRLRLGHTDMGGDGGHHLLGHMRDHTIGYMVSALLNCAGSECGLLKTLTLLFPSIVLSTLTNGIPRL